MTDHIEAGIGFANAQLGKPYVFGASGPDEWDCIGLMRKAARAMGYDGSEFPAFVNVRQLTKWAEDNGYLRLAVDGYQGQRGDLFLWGDANSADHRPVKGAGHVGMVKKAPAAGKPNGRAISAFNPQKGVINHGIAPKPGTHVALYGFVVLPPPTPEPVTEPEIPPPSGAVDPVPVQDDPPTVEELQAKIDKAKEALA